MKRALLAATVAATGVLLGQGVMMIANAQQAQPPAAYQTMLNDYRALEAATVGVGSSMDHFKVSLQAVLDQVVKEQQKAAAEARSGEDRLKWVLDNWVKQEK